MKALHFLTIYVNSKPADFLFEPGLILDFKAILRIIIQSECIFLRNKHHTLNLITLKQASKVWIALKPLNRHTQEYTQTQTLLCFQFGLKCRHFPLVP